MTYTYILSYNIYVKPGETPVTIDTTAYGNAYTFHIQDEEIEKWISYNSNTTFKPYNYFTMTVNKPVYAYEFTEQGLEAAQVDNGGQE